MTTVIVLADAAGIASLAYMLIVLGRLSRHLGEVVKMRPLYRWFYAAAGLALWTALAQVVIVALSADHESAAWVRSERLALVVLQLPLLLGMLIALPTAWRYWGWLLRER